MSSSHQQQQTKQYKNLSKLFVCRFNPSFLHILKNPKVLPCCGNTACEDCIKDALDSKSGQLRCTFEKCKRKHEIKTVETLVTNVMVEDILNDNISTIADHIIAKIKKRFLMFKETLSEKQSLIDKVFEFIEGEIEIRVESIKIELDNLHTQLVAECKKLKEAYSATLSEDFTRIENSFQNYETLLTQNLADFEPVKLKENIYSCQNFIKDLQSFDQNFNQRLKKCSFAANEWLPSLALIGRIERKATLNFDQMKTSSLQVINLEHTTKSLNRMFTLNEHRLLLTSSDDNTIIEVDENFNELRRISTIQSHRLVTPLSICSDNSENVYICDLGNNCVLVTDLEVTRVKRVIGRKSLDCGQPIDPLDICFYSDKLYVLNKDSSHVTLLTRNGDFIAQQSLYAAIKTTNNAADNTSIGSDLVLSRPNRIGANDKVYAVLDSFRKVYIYEALSGELKQVIKSHNSTIMCLIDDYIFTCNRDGSLVCYQQSLTTSGQRYSQVFERTIDLLKDSKSHMCFFNNRFLVALTDSKSIVAL